MGKRLNRSFTKQDIRKFNEYMKGSILLVIREIEIKTPMRSAAHTPEWLNWKRQVIFVKDVEQLEFEYIWIYLFLLIFQSRKEIFEAINSEWV